ncbi:hypothetical protein, partial [Escherichia coli]|uniref:hypothetical protein n=1 Tax=Escherichia coli TaxID=562 RepID=UPI001BFC0E9D
IITLIQYATQPHPEQTTGLSRIIKEKGRAVWSAFTTIRRQISCRHVARKHLSSQANIIATSPVFPW